jgi:hypothetical protein
MIVDVAVSMECLLNSNELPDFTINPEFKIISVAYLAPLRFILFASLFATLKKWIKSRGYQTLRFSPIHSSKLFNRLDRSISRLQHIVTSSEFPRRIAVAMRIESGGILSLVPEIILTDRRNPMFARITLNSKPDLLANI